MVDSVSNAKTIRQAGSATTRYGASPASASNSAAGRPVAPVASSGDATRQDQDDHNPKNSHDQELDGAQGLRLEIAEEADGRELIYRFVDAISGDVVREWPAGEFGKLRDYMRDKKIRLLDKKI